MFGIYALVDAFEQHKKRKEWIASMPKEEQRKMRENDKKNAREELAQRRAIDIAEAGRARNFWGK